MATQKGVYNIQILQYDDLSFINEGGSRSSDSSLSVRPSMINKEVQTDFTYANCDLFYISSNIKTEGKTTKNLNIDSINTEVNRRMRWGDNNHSPGSENLPSELSNELSHIITYRNMQVPSSSGAFNPLLSSIHREVVGRDSITVASFKNLCENPDLQPGYMDTKTALVNPFLQRDSYNSLSDTAKTIANPLMNTEGLPSVYSSINTSLTKSQSVFANIQDFETFQYMDISQHMEHMYHLLTSSTDLNLMLECAIRLLIRLDSDPIKDHLGRVINIYDSNVWEIYVIYNAQDNSNSDIIDSIWNLYMTLNSHIYIIRDSLEY